VPIAVLVPIAMWMGVRMKILKKMKMAIKETYHL
jgi:hypothetical protein